MVYTLLGMTKTRRSGTQGDLGERTQLAVKRSLDVMLSAIALLLLVLPFGLIALAIKLDSEGPVFFRQERVGLQGRRFRVLKFRTMVEGAERIGARYGFVADDPRITRVGRLLRLTSVDELPQLFNVLRGEMSLVGPRPTLPYQVDLYTEEQRRRLSVNPGITGLALIRGRNELPWSERIAYDLEYIANWSIWMDVRILWMTLWAVILRQGLRMDQDVSEVEDFERPASSAGRVSSDLDLRGHT